jgi:integrase
MKQKIRVTFFLQKTQSKKLEQKDNCYIYYYLMQGGKKILSRSTYLKCKKFEFDPDLQRFTGERAIELNLELVRIKQKISEDVAKFLNDGDARTLYKGLKFDAVEFKNELKPFIEVYNEYVSFQSSIIRKKGEKKHMGNIEPGTYKTYLIRRDNSLIPYLNTLRPTIIKLKNIDLMFLENYFIWLTTTKTWQGKSRGTAYANKCMKIVKTVMKYATNSGYLYENVTVNHRNKREIKKPVHTLSPQDIELLENCEIFTEREKRVVDVFLFCKETFLHIGDFQDLRSEHIKTDKDGDRWIVKDRIKAQEEGVQVQRVPLTKRAIEILEKYGSVEKMPYYRDGSISYTLKIAAEKAGIKKNVSFKMARSSGISEAYNEKSLRGESIAVCAGWTSTKELRTYLAVDYGQLKNEFTNSIVSAKNGSMYQI